MKELKSDEPKRQRLYEHKGKGYSVVDLCEPFATLESPTMSREEWRELTSFYMPYNFELADISSEHVKIIGRFTSFEEAKSAIRFQGIV